MNISFALTTRQFRERTKDVTRRLGWQLLKPGTILCAVEKGQGIKKGEHVIHMGTIRVLSVRREPLDKMWRDPIYGISEVVREGFPKMTPPEFVKMFCKHNQITEEKTVTRIEFEYL